MSLREAGVVVYDCEHRTPLAATAGYPYVAIPQLRDGRIDFSGARLISEADYQAWTRRALPQGGDVVLSRRTNPGETAFVPDGAQFALGQNLVILRSVGDVVYPPFLRWLARSPQWWDQIRKFLNVGAVFDSLRCADIPKFELPIPPYATQQRVVQMLGALDDKIDLNRRVNDTIQNMLRAEFKTIDTARDFVPIEKLAKVVGGSTPSTANESYWAGTFAWATPKDLAGLRDPVLLDTARHITDDGLAQVGSGLLPAGTVLLSSRAPIGYLAISEVPVAINQGFIAMVPNGQVSRYFLLRWAEAHMDEIKSRANGTTFQEISKANFRPMTVGVPSGLQLQQFDELAEPLHSLLVANTRESHSLAQLRDLLLPELISGRTTVK